MLDFNKTALLTCFILFFPLPVFAEDDEISVIGGVSYNFKNEDFMIGTKPFKPRFTTIDWSVIATYKSAYLRFNFDQSIKDEALIDNSPNGGGSTSNQVILFSREDMGLTLGFSVLDNLSLFMGYTRGETNGIGIVGVESIGPPLTINNLDININEQGPFVGASYIYYPDRPGSLSFSVAYAQLDGEVSIMKTITDYTNGAVTFDPIGLEGEANGLSYSLTWSDVFSDRMLYNVSFKTTRYKFDAPLVGVDDFDFDDVYNVISFGLSKYF